MAETDFIKNIYEDFKLGQNLDAVIEVAANEGYIFLQSGFAKSKCGRFETAALLLPREIAKYKTMDLAHKHGISIAPEWFEYNAEKDYFTYNETAFIESFINHYNVTKNNGTYTMDGKSVSADDIKAALLKSLSIIRTSPGEKIYSAFYALSIKAASRQPEEQVQDSTTEHRDPVTLFDDFIGKVKTEAYKPLQTGMQSFDRLLGGGIQRQALVILSAAPGTGKTTLVQQIFETMAAHGTDVIFLNLEMSREQLLARSLSRIIHRNGGSITASGILKGYAWTDEMRRYIEPAAAKYRAQIAPHMHYNPEGCGTMLSSIVDTLNRAAETAKAAGKPAPVVVLDYLHLVTMEHREDQQEIIKKTVAALKQYAIENDTFVLAISANNRAATSTGTVTLESGRDSSALEYTADIQLSLNYRALHEKSEITYKTADGRTVTEKASANNPDHMEALQREKPRKMMVQVLKNRMTEPGGKLYLHFDAANSEFIPVETHAQEPVPPGWIVISNDPNNPFKDY